MKLDKLKALITDRLTETIAVSEAYFLRHLLDKIESQDDRDRAAFEQRCKTMCGPTWAKQFERNADGKYIHWVVRHHYHTWLKALKYAREATDENPQSVAEIKALALREAAAKCHKAATRSWLRYQANIICPEAQDGQCIE